jgi:hypothetical protein
MLNKTGFNRQVLGSLDSTPLDPKPTAVEVGRPQIWGPTGLSMLVATRPGGAVSMRFSLVALTLAYSIIASGCATGQISVRSARMHCDACREAHLDMSKLCAEERSEANRPTYSRAYPIAGLPSWQNEDHMKDWRRPPPWLEVPDTRVRNWRVWRVLRCSPADLVCRAHGA